MLLLQLHPVRQAQQLQRECTMTQHYPTTSAAAAAWGSGPSFPVSATLLIYTYSLLSATALSKTLLFVLCLLQTRDKERCGSSR